MKRFIPIPGDLIIVEFSEWYALKDGERLRVCESAGWMEEGEELHVAPRHQVTTFWGPDYGPPDGFRPVHMSTSGGPFKTVPIKDLAGLELVGEEQDCFWCWQDCPRANGGMDRLVTVALWRVAVDASLVHPREVFKPAIIEGSASILLSHNHPSGNPTPNREDIQVTDRLTEAGKLIGISVLDHIIHGDGTGEVRSIREH